MLHAHTAPLMTQASIDIIRYALAPVGYYPSSRAPSTYKALLAWYEGNDRSLLNIPVHAGGSSSSIYGSCEGNWAFRAWHDATHLKHSLGFTLKDETRVAELQVEEARLAGMCEADLKLLWIDVYGQVLYYDTFKEYVTNQKEFVNRCLQLGIKGAINSYMAK